jgi:hypothetical protein
MNKYYAVRYDNGSGYMEWAAPAFASEHEAKNFLAYHPMRWSARTDIIPVTRDGEVWIESKR